MGARRKFALSLPAAFFLLKTDRSATDRVYHSLFSPFPGIHVSFLSLARRYALGGGLELALACHFRIGFGASLKLGLPEIQLGLIPGAGGTQRLPLIIGLVEATKLLFSGKAISGKRAHALHLLDWFDSRSCSFPDDDQAQLWLILNQIGIYGFLSLRKERSMQFSRNDYDFVEEFFRRQEEKKKRGNNKLSQAERSLKTTLLAFIENQGNISRGFDIERREFLLLTTSPTFHALRYVFFATNQATKISSQLQQHQNNTTNNTTNSNRLFTKAVVLGGGTMGRGIALSLLEGITTQLKKRTSDQEQQEVLGNGQLVVIIERDEAAMEQAIQGMEEELNVGVRLGKLGESEKDVILHHLLGFGFMYHQEDGMKEGQQQLLNDEFKDHVLSTSILIEAVPEIMKLKQRIFSLISSILMEANATVETPLLGSNTSSLDLDAIADSLNPTLRPYFCGVHFFSPAHLMKLVELVRSRYSNKSLCLDPITLFCKQFMRKVPVTVNNAPGFVGNRLMAAFVSESLELVVPSSSSSSFAHIQEVDQAMKEFGFPLGPFEMMDVMGLDVILLVKSEQLFDGKEEEEDEKDPRWNLIRALVEQGRCGRKSGKGFYNYVTSDHQGTEEEESKGLERARDLTQSGFLDDEINSILDRFF